jgi:hypothetical protein
MFRAYFVLLVLLVLVGPGCQVANPSRVVAERFVQALRSEGDAHIEAYLNADAEVFLQGAPTPMSGARFHEYVDVLRRGRQEFEPASRVFVTATGAGWLLSIGPTADAAPAAAIPAQLWMQTTIQDERITRLWIHFTVDALPRMAVTPEVYRSLADARGISVPEGWSEGTPALLAAAERADRLVEGNPADATRQAVIVSVAVLAVSIGFFAARMRIGHQRQRSLPGSSGALLEHLRRRQAIKAGMPIRG